MSVPLPSIWIVTDLVWPALDLAGSYLVWWVILAGLLVEYPVVLWVCGLSPWRALVALIAMNIASALLGTFLFTIAGVVWEIFPGFLIHGALDVGTYNPITWAATFLLAILANTLVEAFVLIKSFDLKFSWRHWISLGVANAISVALAMVELRTEPGMFWR